MSRAHKALILFVVSALAVWGCARPTGHAAAQAERLKNLETKCGKLEDDYRAVASARDLLRKRFAAVEEERNKFAHELEQLNRERDALKAQVEARTGERDTLNVRCEKMRKGLQSILGQDDALAPSNNAPVTTGPELANPGKS